MLLNDAEKRILLNIIGSVSGFSGVDVMSFAIMANHFHLLIKVPKRREVDDNDLVVRMQCLYGVEKTKGLLASWELWNAKGDSLKVIAAKDALKKRMFNLSDFFKTLKERFSKNFNRRDGCSGTFWSERFTSVLLESEGDVLPTIGAYIDLNPVRAEITVKPEEYEFSSFGAAMRGDVKASEGIRELVAAADPRNKQLSLTEALDAYKRIMDGEVPFRAVSAKRKMSSTSPSVGEVAERARRSEKLRSRQRGFWAGAAIGTFEFIGKILNAAFYLSNEVRSPGFTPWQGRMDEYYHARRVNGLRRQ